MEKYGTHKNITCDSCACSPVQGFRYKCRTCKNRALLLLFEKNRCGRGTGRGSWPSGGWSEESEDKKKTDPSLALALADDICETCFEKFKEGVLEQDAQLARVNKVSTKLEDHDFEQFAEAGSFVPLGGSKQGTGATPAGAKKTKPNDKCPCDSGSKYKKCCGKAKATAA